MASAEKAFRATYDNAVDKVLKELVREQGINVELETRPLSIETPRTEWRLPENFQMPSDPNLAAALQQIVDDGVQLDSGSDLREYLLSYRATGVSVVDDWFRLGPNIPFGMSRAAQTFMSSKVNMPVVEEIPTRFLTVHTNLKYRDIRFSDATPVPAPVTSQEEEEEPFVRRRNDR